MEVEVDAVLVLSKRVKLRQISGEIVSADLRVYESEDPYVLVFMLETDHHDDLRMDIFKEQLATELRGWLEGKYIRHPAMLVPVRIDDSIMKFIKFAKTPKQEDLIMWILSRTEYYPRDKVGHSLPELVFGGKMLEEVDERLIELKMSVENQFSKTATIAAAKSADDDYHYRTGRTKEQTTSSMLNESEGGSKVRSQSASRTRTGSGTTAVRELEQQLTSGGEDLGMFEMTRQLLGKSQTLEALKSTRVKGREGAKKAISTNSWSTDQWRVCQEIERTRKDIEQRMDERRRVIEVARIRQSQFSDKFRKIKDTVKEAQGGNVFMSNAQQELMSLKKIEADIEDDIRRQKNRVQRGTQRVAWTMAPSGYANRRGKSMKGPVLGPGPLHPNATSTLKDPKLEVTMRRFYWDSAGRRHIRPVNEDADEQSLVEAAMNAIRRAAANISAFKLDLKAVFQQFDTSHDGFLSPLEMAQAFISMGVKLDISTMKAIFKHFDPNDSGSVHYGEFVWAFFNRRGMVRKWKRKTEGLTKNKIRARFHEADINGNGTLSPKEFKRVLKSFDIELPEKEIEIMMERFDVDGDGDIDIDEFFAFIESEQKNFGGDQDGTLKSTMDIPPSKGNYSASVGAKPPRPASANPAARGRETTRPSSGSAGRPSSASQSRSVSRDRSASATRPTPASAPSPRSQHNVTAPAALQPSKHKQHPRDSNAPIEYLYSTNGEEQGEDEKKLSATTSQLGRPAGGGKLEEDVDVAWMSRMLQAQAEIESRLGKRYYKNR